MQRYSPDKQSGLYFSKSKRENAGRKKMKAYERLLKYITVWTTSDENSTTVPTTKKTARPWESSGRRDERDGTFGCVDG